MRRRGEEQMCEFEIEYISNIKTAVKEQGKQESMKSGKYRYAHIGNQI